MRTGLERGLQAARYRRLLFYESRFGEVPPAVSVRIRATSDLDTPHALDRACRPRLRDDVDRELGAG